MILIVNTTEDRGITGTLATLLDSQNKEYEVIEASSLEIKPCIGCNFCWLKTPGVCSIKDDYEQILKKIIKANQLWVISDTALGFIDHKGKNIFDRILPIATMYIRFVGDQMRHVPRYDGQTDVGIIYKGTLEREYAQRWTERCALNFDSKSLGVYGEDELKEAAACMS